MKLSFVPRTEFERVLAIPDRYRRCELFADLCRINMLYMIMRAGSGHIGTSMSAMDIVSWLWLCEMKSPNNLEADVADLYFSSKGHDVPGLYSVLIGLGHLDFEYLHKLRRLGGLPGHPDVSIPGIIANTGSLGMGISKARGMVLARRTNGKHGRIFVLVGDGELQEGQIWESLQPTANGGFGEITVIADLNSIQSDTWVRDTSDLGDLAEKFGSFGWATAWCYGHDIRQLDEVFLELCNRAGDRQPKVLLARTEKGKGVSFMEQMGEDGLYKFHSGAPSVAHYEAALAELVKSVDDQLAHLNLVPLVTECVEVPNRVPPEGERLVAAYGDELVQIGRERKDVVVLDADLAVDCGVLSFKREFPRRFVECGIAEQDMVSMAGGLALQGMVPVVNSFACFLSTRPNEQIYTNATERTKIIYVAGLAGLLPAGPGHSHQSVRDIAALGATPGLTMIQPSCEREARMAIRWAVEKNPESTYIRLVSVPCALPYTLDNGYKLVPGCGTFLRTGDAAVLIAYGPVMLAEAMRAADMLSEERTSVAVVNLPWLNRIDAGWLYHAISRGEFRLVVTIDDHYTKMGQGMQVGATLAAFNPPSLTPLISLGLEHIPACGEAREALAHHGLDAESIARIVREHL